MAALSKQQARQTIMLAAAGCSIQEDEGLSYSGLRGRRLSVVKELEAVVTTHLQHASRLRQDVLQKAFAGEL
jgi:hypothetical protein